LAKDERLQIAMLHGLEDIERFNRYIVSRPNQQLRNHENGFL